MPRVSVIATAMNHEQFVEQGLDAIAAQTFGDFELVIADDASKDATAEVIRAWLARSGRPATFISHEERRGLGPTVVEAIDHCSGELLAIVSLYDLWRPDRLAAHVAAFEGADDDVAVVYSDCDVIGESGSLLHPSWMAACTPFGTPGRPPPSGDVFEAMVESDFLCASMATSRRSAVEAVGGYDGSLPMWDRAMWLNLASGHRFVFVAGALGSHRLAEAGVGRSTTPGGHARRDQFTCLASAHGRRLDVDPLVLRRLRGLVETMAANEDEGAAGCAARLAELDPPVVLPATDPHDDRVRAAAALIAQGYSIAAADGPSVTLRPSASSILYLAPWLTVGGADKATVDWFRHIGRDSFRRFLVTTAPGDNSRFGDCEALADEAWCLPELMSRDRIPQFLAELIANRGIDLVHIMNSKIGIDLMPALKLAYPDLPIVVQFHGPEEAGGYPRYAVSRYGNLVDAYSVASDEMGRILTGYGVSPSRIEVIHPGVDAEVEFDPRRADGVGVHLAPGRFHVLVPARVTGVKRPEMVLEVALAVRPILPAVQFHLVGDGDLRRDLEVRVTRLGLDDVVVLHGPSANMWGWYDACDVSLLPSGSAGVPLVVLEAMSMGVPTVAPLVGEIGDVLDERSGIGLPADAGADAFAAALVALAQDPARRQAIAGSSRRRVLDGYRVETSARRHRALYGALIARARMAP